MLSGWSLRVTEQIFQDQKQHIAEKATQKTAAAVNQHICELAASPRNVKLDLLVRKRDTEQKQQKVQRSVIKQRTDMHGQHDQKAKSGKLREMGKLADIVMEGAEIRIQAEMLKNIHQVMRDSGRKRIACRSDHQRIAEDQPDIEADQNPDPPVFSRFQMAPPSSVPV